MTRVALVAALILAAGVGCLGPGDVVTVGAATSLRDAGLADALADAYEADTGTGARLVHGGSGELAALARRGDVDVILTHHPDAEEALVREGVATRRDPVMANAFVLAGPAGDPASIADARDAAAALAAIHGRGAAFASRGDASGTHAREIALWHEAGLDPSTFDASWYREMGQGQAGTLRYAAETGAYTLVDDATWRTLHAKGRTGDLAVLFRDPGNLTNVYHVLPLAGHPRGHTFADWVTSPDAAARIAALEVDGEPLFRPTTPEA